MRKLYAALLLFLASAMTLCSCRGAADEASGGSPFGVRTVLLRVSSEEMLPFPDSPAATRSTDVATLCDKLCLAVYSGGKLDTLASRLSSDGSFGNVSIRLKGGRYRFLLLAHNSAKAPDVTDPEKIDFGMQNVSDVLYWSDELTVARDTSFNVSLRRAVARVDVVTTDTIPSAVGSMYFIVTKGSYILNALTGYGVYSGRDYKSIPIPDSLAHRPGTFSFYTFPTAEEVSASVTLRAIRIGETGIYCSRDFEDVPLKRNTVTRLAGEFFKKQ